MKKKKKVSFGIGHVVIFTALAFVASYFLFSTFPNFQTSAQRSGKYSKLFSNYSAQLTRERATFNFTYDGTGTSYLLDASVKGRFNTTEWKTGDWVIFGQTYLESESQTTPPMPIVVENPTAKWSKYTCGATIYWRVRTPTGNGVDTSDIQQAVVNCSTP